ncbi:hypothetical protein Ancab_031813 [Ancistrocladus abbreviatus]
MFNKIIKRGHRKGSKADDSAFGYAQSGNRGSGVVSTSNVVVNHASRVGPPGAGGPNFCASSWWWRERLMRLPHCRAPLKLCPCLGMSRKLQICCYQFDFSDALKSIREKEIKRQTLSELVDFIQSGSGKVHENVQEEMIRMVSINIFRCLPPASHENTGVEVADPEEEEPYMEPSWPHLQIVYELLLRYIMSQDTDTKVAKRYIDHSFVLKLLDLFDSEDPREREYLKTILHRIYGKFMVHRPFIRKAINNIFYRFYIWRQRGHSGIGELLEILGQYSSMVGRGAGATQAAEFQRCMVPLFRQIARCLNSPHFQVAERALFLWNNEHIVSLIAQNRNAILPIIFEALEKNIQSHWNQAVHGLTVNVRKMFLDMDVELFEECQRQFEEKQAKARDVEEQRQLAWRRLAEVAGEDMVTV